MVAEARLKSKNLYKVELYLLKIMPMVIALAYLVNTVSSYFGVDIPILASIAGMSLIPLIFMYISLNGKVYVGQTCNLSERWRNNGKNYFNSIKFYNAIKKYGWDNFTHEVVYSNLNKQAADKLEKELIHKYNSIEEGYNLKEGGSRGELSTKSLAKMSESLKRGYSEFPERREKIRNKALGRKMPKDTRCKISLNHSKSNLLKINDEVGSIRYWALKIGKAHSVLSYRLKVHGIDNLRKYIEQRIKLV